LLSWYASAATGLSKISILVAEEFLSAQTSAHFRALRGTTVDFARIRTFLSLHPRIARMKLPFCADTHKKGAAFITKTAPDHFY